MSENVENKPKYGAGTPSPECLRGGSQKTSHVYWVM